MTIFGWDMSHFDSPSIGNAVGQGISFITHKAGGDSSSGDAELDNWWAGVRGLPQSVVLGAYWVLRPDLMSSAANEADNFLGRLDAVCKGWRDRDSFILQLDAEEWGSNSATKPSIGQCNAFCDRLVARTSGRYMPVGYLPKWVYGNVSVFRYPVWASSYVTGSGSFGSLYPGDSSSKWNAYGKPVSILQYSSSATIGGQTTCDANAFRGQVADLKKLVTPGGDMAVQLNQDDLKAIEAQVWNHLEDDPQPQVTGATQRRVGGDMRYIEARRHDMENRLNAKLADLDTKLSALSADVADGVPANVDVNALAAALDALLPDVTVDEATLIQAFRDMANAVPTPPAS